MPGAVSGNQTRQLVAAGDYHRAQLAAGEKRVTWLVSAALPSTSTSSIGANRQVDVLPDNASVCGCTRTYGMPCRSHVGLAVVAVYLGQLSIVVIVKSYPLPSLCRPESHRRCRAAKFLG